MHFLRGLRQSHTATHLHNNALVQFNLPQLKQTNEQRKKEKEKKRPYIHF